MKTKKHLFFDMDHTITPARQPITEKMYTLLTSLPQDIIVVSGSTLKQMRTQINEFPCFKLGQNGNQAVDMESVELWNFKLTDKHKQEINEHIKKIIPLVGHELNPDWNPIEDRGGQITFSPLGNTAPYEIKKMYDPDASKRFGWLHEVPFTSDELVVKIGGSTSFDYIHKDKNKGTNVAKLLEHTGWNPDDCIYYGDGLYPGGNDEAVIGVIDTVAVTSDEDTYEKLSTLYK